MYIVEGKPGALQAIDTSLSMVGLENVTASRSWDEVGG